MAQSPSARILKVDAQSPTRILDWVQLTTMPASSSSSPYNVEAENSVESSAIWLSMRSPMLSSAPLTTCCRPLPGTLAGSRRDSSVSVSKLSSPPP